MSADNRSEVGSLGFGNDGGMTWLPNITADPDPMRRVREAQARGEEVHMVTGRDEATDTIVIFWHIVGTNELVMEGALYGDL